MEDTLILADQAFRNLEQTELTFKAKPKESLTTDNKLIFNGCILTKQADGSITLQQKEQGKKLKIVDYKSPNYEADYREQRARGQYVATICQPEAQFDLSAAAQHKSPGEEEVNALNMRLSWQINNLERGLRFVTMDLSTTKLFVFVDGSFANNKDFTSQIGYELMIANELSSRPDRFKIRGNLIHWSSTKTKRVTRSVLASEIYGMVAGVDMAIALSTTINMITKQLGLDDMELVVCTDSFSLYECLVKLGTTKEKRLMIDIMALRQSYERRELQEVDGSTGTTIQRTP